MFFKKKLTEFDIYKKVLQYAVLNNGVISSKKLGVNLIVTTPADNSKPRRPPHRGRCARPRCRRALC